MIFCQVIYHIQLNRDDKPCEESEDYRFGDCVLNFISVKVGCQPVWNHNHNSTVPTCRTEKQLSQYQKTYYQLMQLEKRALQVTAGCKNPCNYFEYKVSHLSKSVYDNIYNSIISPACLWPIHILCGERVELENTFRKQPDNDGGGGLQLRARWLGRRLRGDSWPFCWLQLPHGVGLSSQRCEENKRIYWK